MEETVGLKDFEGFKDAIVNADNYIDGLGIRRIKLCEKILEINESTLRSLLKSKMRYEISKDTLISCYKLYMLQPENKKENYKNFFEGNIEVYIKDINIEECRNKLYEMIPLHKKNEAEELAQILPMDEDKLEEPDPVIADDEKEVEELEHDLTEDEDRAEEPAPIAIVDERESEEQEEKGYDAQEIQMIDSPDNNMEETPAGEISEPIENGEKQKMGDLLLCQFMDFLNDCLRDKMISPHTKEETEKLGHDLSMDENKTEEPAPIAIVDERESEEQEEKGSDAQEIQMIDPPNNNMEEISIGEMIEPVEKVKEQREAPMPVCQFMDFLNDCLGVYYEFELLDWSEKKYFKIQYRKKIDGNAEGKEWNVMAAFDMRDSISEIDEIFLEIIDKVNMIWFIIKRKDDIGDLSYFLWRKKIPQFYEKDVFETNGDKIYISQNASGIRWKQLINGRYPVRKK